MTSSRATEILSGVASASPGAFAMAEGLVAACTAALPVTGVGLVLMSDAGPAGSVAVTDGAAATMEELQFTLGEGPCVESSRTGRPVLQPDLARTAPARWPAFTEGALAAGIRAIFAFPLRIGLIRVGVLDLYRDRAGLLTDSELAEALSYADAATLVLLHLHGETPDGSVQSGSIPVLEDRHEVHQATGVVSVHAGVDLAAALALLRARAYATEQPIVQLARQVMTGDVSFR